MNEVPLQEWIDGGHYIEFDSHQIFVHTSGAVPNAADLPPGADPDVDGVFIIHGFPGSSWDWAAVAAEVSKHTRIVIFDLFGHGNTDKPMEGGFEENYSLFKQADLAEAVAKAEGLHNVILVCHDMGQTVAAELMWRQDQGKLSSFKIHHSIVHNGSTLIDLVVLNKLQQDLLDLPDEPFKEDLPRANFEAGLRETFSKEHPATDVIVKNMIDQIMTKHGSRIMPVIIRYLLQRKHNEPHWQGALTEFSSAPFSLYWGLQDPVSIEAMPDRIKKLRPSTDLHKWPDVAHWPPIEVPERISKAIIDRLNG